MFGSRPCFFCINFTNPYVLCTCAAGVAYSIDQILGNCSIIPIQNVSFDATLNVTVTSNGYYVAMKSPDQLFYLDNTSYTYEGQVRAQCAN